MIYCVEDDSSIRELMLYALRASGFQAEGFETAAPIWKTLEAEKPELILLDIMLPDEDGISILKKLRRFSKWAQLPVIMATAKGTEFDKVTGLDLGGRRIRTTKSSLLGGSCLSLYAESCFGKLPYSSD